MKRGDIYFINGGVAHGSEQAGDRPGVIVSNDTGNEYAEVVEVVWLTTKSKKRLPTHVNIRSSERWSVALCEQISTVSKDRMERYINCVSDREMQRIDRALGISLGLDNTEKGMDEMNVCITAENSEMNFNLSREEVLSLIDTALKLAGKPKQETVSSPESSQRAQEAPLLFPTEDFPVETENTPESAPEPRRSYSGVRERAEAAAGYKGFLMIRCDHCGKVKGFCAKTPVTHYRCECGEKTELYDLRRVSLRCKCGSFYRYKTNITDQRIEYNCLNCGGPVDMEWNERRNIYDTIAERE